MKKQNMIKLAAAAALTLGLSGNALAAIDNGDLIRVVYDTVGSVEYATDLGSFQDILTRTAAGEKNIVVGDGVDAVKTTIFGTSTQMADLRVAYFTYSPTGYWVGVATNGETDAMMSVAVKYSTFKSASQSLTYGATGTTGAYDLNMVTANSAKLADKSGTSFYSKFSASILENYANWTATANAGGIPSLAALATTGGEVTNNFFSWDGTDINAAVAGDKRFTLTMLADGSTVINKMDEAPVPVPAAAWLLASGLAGLVGVRRRMNKEA